MAHKGEFMHRETCTKLFYLYKLVRARASQKSSEMLTKVKKKIVQVSRCVREWI
jgi:hypothetical protein